MLFQTLILLATSVSKLVKMTHHATAEWTWRGNEMPVAKSKPMLMSLKTQQKWTWF